MSVTFGQEPNISFGTQFNYLHIVLKGTVSLGGSNPGSASIDLPAGLTNPFFRVFIINGDILTNIQGYYGSGSDAKIVGDQLVIQVYSGGGGGAAPVQTFTYFIYGGNYV